MINSKKKGNQHNLIILTFFLSFLSMKRKILMPCIEKSPRNRGKMQVPFSSNTDEIKGSQEKDRDKDINRDANGEGTSGMKHPQ